MRGQGEPGPVGHSGLMLEAEIGVNVMNRRFAVIVVIVTIVAVKRFSLKCIYHNVVIINDVRVKCGVNVVTESLLTWTSIVTIVTVNPTMNVMAVSVMNI